MCMIAGYTGSKRAAPILVDMLRRQQYFDGGLSTGIATVHEGKLYTAKVLGDLDVLLERTDALNFPGSVGIIHSRTKDNLLSHAHPFTDDSGKLALVLNGTSRGVRTPEYWDNFNGIMQDFFDRGMDIKSLFEDKSDAPLRRVLKNKMSYSFTEFYSLFIGDKVKNSTQATLGDDLAQATRLALETAPANIVALHVHTDLPDTVTAGIVTRPMVAAVGEGETFMATSALALPENLHNSPIISLPPTSVSQITPAGVRIVSTTLETVRVEQIDYRIAAETYRRVEEALKGQKNSPKSLYEIPAMPDVWSQPMVDCKYAVEGGLLKPTGTAVYEALWALHKQGRLGITVDKSGTKPVARFWVE